MSARPVGIFHSLNLLELDSDVESACQLICLVDPEKDQSARRLLAQLNSMEHKSNAYSPPPLLLYNAQLVD